MNNFVEGISIIEKLIPIPFINHMVDDQIAILCNNFPLKPPHCKTCKKDIPPDLKQRLLELGFSIVDHKCYIVYDFNKNKDK